MKELTKFIDNTKREKDELRQFQSNIHGYKDRLVFQTLIISNNLHGNTLCNPLLTVMYAFFFFFFFSFPPSNIFCRPLVLRGKVIIKCDCGLVAQKTNKIEQVKLILFDSGILICKYIWKDLLKVRPFSSKTIRNLRSVLNVNVRFCCLSSCNPPLLFFLFF